MHIQSLSCQVDDDEFDESHLEGGELEGEEGEGGSELSYSDTDSSSEEDSTEIEEPLEQEGEHQQAGEGQENRDGGGADSSPFTTPPPAAVGVSTGGDVEGGEEVRGNAAAAEFEEEEEEEEEEDEVDEDELDLEYSYDDDDEEDLGDYLHVDVPWSLRKSCHHMHLLAGTCNIACEIVPKIFAKFCCSLLQVNQIWMSISMVVFHHSLHVRTTLGRPRPSGRTWNSTQPQPAPSRSTTPSWCAMPTIPSSSLPGPWEGPVST